MTLSLKDKKRIKKYLSAIKETSMEEKIIEVKTPSGRTNLTEIKRDRITEEKEDKHVRGEN